MIRWHETEPGFLSPAGTHSEWELAADSAVGTTSLLVDNADLEADLRRFFAGHLSDEELDTCHESDVPETIPSTIDSGLPTFAQSQDDDELQPPRMFGRYRILRRLGEGGMGMVFLAHDTVLERDVALKFPRFSGREDAEIDSRFYREARAAAALHHPLICPIYDIGEIDGTKYISMACVKGQSLSHIMRTSIPSMKQSARTIQMLTCALAEAHDHGIIHRDLTPSNILINRRGQPIIVDFGLARRVDTGRSINTQITGEGVILGTPGYMSPEQVEGENDQLGPATDIYSLGVVLYQLLTGSLPFTGSYAAVMGKIMTQDPPRPSALRPGVDLELEAICLRMMAKSPEDRYPSMRSLDQVLSEYLCESSIADGVVSSEQSGCSCGPECPGSGPVAVSSITREHHR